MSRGFRCWALSLVNAATAGPAGALLISFFYNLAADGGLCILSAGYFGAPGGDNG
jgi:hypothetical protein